MRHALFAIFIVSFFCLAACHTKDPLQGRHTDRAGDIELPAILSDNAVLQADHPVPIWGKGKPGTRLTIAFRDQIVETTIDQHGRFLAHLPAMAADHDPGTLRITSDSGAVIERTNIIIGEVWLASGQSNMEWELENSAGGQKPAQFADDPSFRIFEIERRQRLRTDGGDIVGQWVVVQPRSARKFSAVGFYFGEKIRAETQLPVGVIQAAYGGTRIEAWTPRRIISGDPSYADDAAILTQAEDAALDRRKEWIRQSELWIDGMRDRQPDALLSTNPPVWPDEDFSKHTPSVLFTGMIEPVLPVSLRGVIWYQGESNWQNADKYEYRLSALINAWRDSFERDLPFGIVQIGPYSRYTEFPKIWDAQRRAVRNLDRTGLIVITDVTDLDDIHPRRKREVGERLALWAIRDVYKLSDAYYTGPLFEGAVFSSDQIQVGFEFAEGLSSTDGDKLSGFELAGSDDVFTPVEAFISSGRSHVVIPLKAAACQLRYEWQPDANPLLTNISGLPASPFHYSECGDEK